MVDRLRKVTQVAALLVFGTSLSVIAAELIAAQIPRIEQRHYLRSREVFQFDTRRVLFDQDLGYAIRPSLRTIFSGREFSTQVRINSAGFRDDEMSLKQPDALLLGDSFGFGWGVEESDSFEKHLESKCNARVLNMSVPGYGTQQQVTLLQRWLEAHGADWTTRVAVFLFYPNDLDDNFDLASGGSHVDLDRNGIPVSEDGRAEFERWQSQSTMSASASWFRSSRVLGLAIDALRLWRAKAEFRPDPQEWLTERLAAWSKTLPTLAATSDRYRLRVIFVLVPPMRPYVGTDTRVLLSGVSQAAGSHGFDVVNLEGILSGTRHYYPYDGHWNVSGHLEAADAVAQAYPAHVRVSSSSRSQTCNLKI
jgi:hypothetical protein